MSDEPRKSPEAAPEGPGTTSGSPGSEVGPWITAAAAAALIGRSERGTRDWLERHAIPARGDRPRLFSEAAIRAALPPEAPGSASGSPRNAPEEPPEAPGSAGERSTPIDVPYRVDGEASTALVPLPTMLRELESFANRIEALALEVGTLRSDLAHVTTERDELQARVEALEAAQAPQEAPEGPKAPPQDLGDIAVPGELREAAEGSGRTARIFDGNEIVAPGLTLKDAVIRLVVALFASSGAAGYLFTAVTHSGKFLSWTNLEHAAVIATIAAVPVAIIVPWWLARGQRGRTEEARR